ncbi:uncharacterized protein LOC116262988 [Nymphaea colorata]|nr:uncharacterized protein LOC116262988 [Nymphaea colorata]
MVGGTGFSWADEVEKEEALQSQTRKTEEKEEESLRIKKQNPFGSARPREIVLQERGIDWRSLDTSFHSTQRIPGKENGQKRSRPTSLTPKKYFPLESHRVHRGHQAATQRTHFNCGHHSLPDPTAIAFAYLHENLPTQSSRARTTEAIYCPQIDASWLGETQRPSCRPVDLGWQSSPFAVVNERQPPQKFDRILEKRFCYGRMERNYNEEQNSNPRNYVEQTRGGPRDLKHSAALSGLSLERSHFTGNNKKRDVQPTTDTHPANQRRSRRRRR